MSYAKHLRKRLAHYDSILERWRKLVDDLPALAIDIAELDRHRELVEAWYMTASRVEARRKPKK
jgi:hypothetical protein